MPGQASAIAVNITVVNPNGDGSLQVREGKTSSSTPKIMQYEKNEVRGTFTLINMDAYRSFWVRSSRTVEVVIDVYGYFDNGSGSSQLHELNTSVRAYDATISGGSQPSITLSQCPGTNATAAMVNITSVSPTSNGYLQAKRTTSVPTGSYSTLNYTPGSPIGNLVIVPLRSGEQFNLYASSSSHVIIDVFACFRPQATSGGLDATVYATPVQRDHSWYYPDTHKDVTAYGAVALMAISTDTTSGNGHFRITRPGSSYPDTASLNVSGGDRVSNHALGRTSGNETRLWRNNLSSGSTRLLSVQVAKFT